MKRIVYVSLTLLVFLLSFSCKKKDEGVLFIGVSKIVSHPALDAVEQGIVDKLKEDGYTNIKFDFQNANGEPATANQIANMFLSNKVDIAVGIATPTAQALAGTLQNIPVVFSAVTDPIGAGLVSSLSGDKRVTGVSDMTPVKTQIDMFTEIKDIKRLGIIYSSNEANSVTIAEILKDVCREKGIEVIESTVVNSAEVKQAAQSIIRRVDGIYISTDNTVVSALSSVIDVATANKIPVFSADPSSASENEVLAAYGFNYYQIGRKTGEIIGKIIDGEETINIPTAYMTESKYLDLVINLDTAAKIGLVIPENILQNAGRVIKDGVEVIQK